MHPIIYCSTDWTGANKYSQFSGYPTVLTMKDNILIHNQPSTKPSLLQHFSHRQQKRLKKFTKCKRNFHICTIKIKKLLYNAFHKKYRSLKRKPVLFIVFQTALFTFNFQTCRFIKCKFLFVILICKIIETIIRIKDFVICFIYKIHLFFKAVHRRIFVL